MYNAGKGLVIIQAILLFISFDYLACLILDNLVIGTILDLEYLLST
jgi:hypothetical protein